MEEQLTFTRSQLVQAFTQWHADCEKHPEGGFKQVAPDDPAGQANILIEYLTAAA